LLLSQKCIAESCVTVIGAQKTSQRGLGNRIGFDHSQQIAEVSVREMDISVALVETLQRAPLGSDSSEDQRESSAQDSDGNWSYAFRRSSTQAADYLMTIRKEVQADTIDADSHVPVQGDDQDQSLLKTTTSPHSFSCKVNIARTRQLSLMQLTVCE
jgi:hypothetical protein